MITKTPRIKTGDVVECVFLDHVEDSTEPLEFALYGRLRKTCRGYVVISCWAYNDSQNHDDDENEKRFTIVKSAIISLRKLTTA